MISYHPTARNPERPFEVAKGFRTVDTADVNRLASCLTNFTFSPIVFRGGYRTQKNFIESFWCAYDFESSEFTLEDALNIFCDMTHVIGTTKSHRIKPDRDSGLICDRFRVVVPWSEPIADLRLYRWNMQRQLKRFPVMDKVCLDGARFFWPCKEIVSVCSDGYAEDVCYDVPKDFEGFKDRHAEKCKQGIIPYWTMRYLTDTVITNYRNNTVFGIAKDLSRCGFSQGDILAKILASPTYVGQPISDTLLKEIQRAVASGARSA